MRKGKITPFKIISGLIAGLLIVIICIITIIQKITKQDNTYWQEFALIGLAIFFLIIIYKGAKYNNLESNRNEKMNG